VGSNIVHRKILKPDGVGFIAERADKGREFVASTDNWFRPAQFANGPDGALYVIDVYREVIEHPLSLPPEIKQHLDLTSGRDRGRIYRVVPQGFKQRPPAKLSTASTAELVAALEHANGWHRDTAARLLFERQDRAAIGPLERLAAESKLPQGRMHALYALAGLKALSADVLLARLSDEHPRVREHAVRLAENVPDAWPKLCQLTDDDTRVRYQLAFSLGEINDPFLLIERNRALAAILRGDGADRWIRLAVFSSLAKGAGDFFATLAADEPWRATGAGRDALYETARYLGRQNNRAEILKLLETLESFSDAELPVSSAVIRGLGDGMARGASSVQEQLAGLGSDKAEQILERMLKTARLVAADTDRASGERIDAVRLLALGSFAESGPVLSELISNRQPQDVQSAALVALARFSDPAIADTLVAAWPELSPRLRAEATEILFSRGGYLQALLTAAEQGKVSLADVEPARLGALAKHPDEAVRKRARPLVVKIQLGRRGDVVEAYRGALSAAGDVSRGRAVFQKICASCHRLEGVGHEIGPSLASFRNRGAEAILINVLDPNREVNPQFVNYILLTQDGRSVTGMIAAETANSVTLRRAEDATDMIERSDIEVLRSTGQSIMPEGLEKEIDPAAMADLLAYLLQAL
jgi:putative heme-binding domain-containing protein